MNKIKISLILLISIISFSVSCDLSLSGLNGAGEVIPQDMSMEKFTKLDLAIDADISITQGSVQNVEIIAQQNIIDNIKKDINNDEWLIKFDKKVLEHEPIKINITMPDIKGISISGSGDIIATNTIDSRDLDLSISGSGNIEFDLSSTNLDTKISGSGDIKLSGSTENQELDISGSGHYYCFDLDSENCDISISGSGDCQVKVNNSLNVKISGSGNVYYKGTPDVSKTITGSGSVLKAD